MHTHCLFLALLLASGSVLASESHCTKQEAIFFNCQINNSKKVLSVCGNKRILSAPLGDLADGKDIYVQYRFGEIGNVEMQFPKSRVGSLNKFEYQRIYAKTAGAYREELKFINSAYTYSVFYDEQTPEGSKKLLITYGVSASKANGTETKLFCAKEPVLRLEALQNYVAGSP